jgi:hypothetical protein
MSRGDILFVVVLVTLAVAAIALSWNVKPESDVCAESRCPAGYVVTYIARRTPSCLCEPGVAP